MLRVVVWVAILGRGCSWEQGDWLLPSISEMVRVGTGVASGSGGEHSEPMGVMLRLMGADSRKAQEFAFQGLISLVHLMCRVMIPSDSETDRRQRSSRDFSFFRFVLKQAQRNEASTYFQAADLLTQMLDPDIIDRILQESDRKLRRFPADSIGCIQALTCKTKPFVRGMQKSLGFFMQREGEGHCREREHCDAAAAWDRAGLIDRMYFFMPSLEEVLHHGDLCDQRFPNCLY